MRTVTLIDEYVDVPTLSVPPDCLISWPELRTASGISWPTLRKYRLILSSHENPKYVNAAQAKRFAKCLAWCDYGMKVGDNNWFNRKTFRRLELQKRLDDEMIKHGINWIPVWNKLAKAMLDLNA